MEKGKWYKLEEAKDAPKDWYSLAVILFDNGDKRFYDTDDWPFATVTHIFFLPDLTQDKENGCRTCYEMEDSSSLAEQLAQEEQDHEEAE